MKQRPYRGIRRIAPEFTKKYVTFPTKSKGLKENFRVFLPNKKRIHTGIGMFDNSGVRNTEHPIVKNIKICVTRCSRTPRNRGFSPGAAHSDSNFSEFTWFILKTVAATNLYRMIATETKVSSMKLFDMLARAYHGSPNVVQICMRMANTNKSKW